MKSTKAITTMEGAIAAATSTMEEFFNPALDADKQIPLSLLKHAHGLAFLTVVKAGFIWTGKVGAGVVVSKLQDGRWSAPSAIGTAGVGFGAEVGAQVISFMIVLSSPAAVQAFMDKAQFSGGVNASFAAGVYGRAAEVNANVSSNGGIAPNYTYSHSQGLFGGVGITGSAIGARNDLNKQFYGRDISPAEILSGAVDQPTAAVCLYDAIDKAYQWDQMARIPAAVQGPEIQLLYDQVLRTVQSYQGAASLEEFKRQCKQFGQGADLQQAQRLFVPYLTKTFSKEQLCHLLPDITRLLDQEKKRQALWELYAESRVGITSPSASSTPSLF